MSAYTARRVSLELLFWLFASRSITQRLLVLQGRFLTRPVGSQAAASNGNGRWRAGSAGVGYTAQYKRRCCLGHEQSEQQRRNGCGESAWRSRLKKLAHSRSGYAVSRMAGLNAIVGLRRPMYADAKMGTRRIRFEKQLRSAAPRIVRHRLSKTGKKGFRQQAPLRKHDPGRHRHLVQQHSLRQRHGRQQ